MTRDKVLAKHNKDKDLTGADLSEVDLTRVNLSGANLTGANLSEADLTRVNLSGAENIPFQFHSNLNILKFQKGTLTAFKYLNSNLTSPYKNFQYEIGKEYICDDYDNDERILCSKGFNVATLEWCLQETNCDVKNKVYVEIEFKAEDIIAIPYNSNGKFRLKKMKIVRQIPKEELEKLIKPLYPFGVEICVGIPEIPQ